MNNILMSIIYSLYINWLRNSYISPHKIQHPHIVPRPINWNFILDVPEADYFERFERESHENGCTYVRVCVCVCLCRGRVREEGGGEGGGGSRYAPPK